MKQEFSTSWLSSRQPRKQRKYMHNAPLHARHKFLSVHLSKDLRKKYGKRNISVRKGDEVLVMRGSSRKKKAKVVSVNYRTLKISLEGLQRTKKDGSKVFMLFSPRNLQIQSLDLSDRKRLTHKNESSSESKGEKNASDKKGSNN